MAKRSEKTQKLQSDMKDWMVVTFVDDIDQARNYESLLKNNEISTTVDENYKEHSGQEKIAVMVHEDDLDEAHVIIEAQDVYDEFHDLSSDTEGDDYFDDEDF